MYGYRWLHQTCSHPTHTCGARSAATAVWGRQCKASKKGQKEGGRRAYEIIKIGISEITLNEEAGRELMFTSNQSSTPVKWHSTHNTGLT